MGIKIYLKFAYIWAMRKIFLIALLISATSAVFGQRYTPFTGFGFEARRLKADSVMLIPSDTTANKTGIVRRGSSLYVGDGTKWTQVQAGAILSDSVVFATRAALYKVADSLGGVIASVTPDSSVFSTKAYRQKGIDSVQANLTAGLALKLNLSDSSLYASRGRLYKVADSLGSVISSVSADSLVFSTKAYRQKGDDSVSALISPRITDSLRSLVRLRASGSGGIQLQNSVGTNVADFGIANTTNGSIAGGWNVGGNLSVTGTSGFTGIVSINGGNSNYILLNNTGVIRGNSTTNTLDLQAGIGGIRFMNANYTSSLFEMTNAGAGTFFTSLGATKGLFGGATDLTGISGGISVSGASSAGVQFRISDVSKGFIYATSGNKIAIDAASGVGFQVYTNASYSTPAIDVGTDQKTTIGGGLVSTAQGNNIAQSVDSAITGTSYTLVLGDAGYFKRVTNSSAVTITIPENSSVAFPVGTYIILQQQGTGQITIAPASSNVSFESPDGALKSRTRYSKITLLKVNTNRWDIGGELTN